MSLLDPAYLAERAKLISQAPGGQSLKVARPGTPGGEKSAFAPMADQIEYGTSHISIVDSFGNAVAMTTTIEDAFGARQMVRGFLLNNELTDFSFAPTDASGAPIANRVEAPCLGKNVLAATNALACANMALAGFDQVIPFDEVVDAAKTVAERMPREHRCTALGGLSDTPTSRSIEKRLAAARGCGSGGCGCG
jgi:hypothetical protein